MMDLLFPALLLSLVLLGIHSYFGLEIIRRGIIFTDLAVGQMAALGAAVSLRFLHGAWLYPISLSFAVFGGLLVAAVSRRAKHLEAFIGLLYASGISAAFILLSKSDHGMEEFGRLMAADILFTPLREILVTAALYAALGLCIYIFMRRAGGLVRDVLFFAAFAVTVTSSVKLAGVLVVFALLVGPALTATAIGARSPLMIAWLVGTAINIVSVAASYVLDLPTGYTLVFFQAATALTWTLAAETGKRGPIE